MTTRARRLGWALVGLLVSPFLRLSREGRLLATAICAAAAFCIDVGRTESHVLLLAASSLLFASVIASRGLSLEGVRAEATAPRRVAVGEPLSVVASLWNQGDRDHRDVRVELPRLSRDGAWVELPATVGSLAPGAREQVVARARFLERGERVIGPLRVAPLVPLGLAQGASIETAPLRVVVVPRPARVLRVTTPRNRRHQPGGVPRASRVGDATELLGVRPYRPGDPVRDLHARSWARAGFPVVREHQEEFFTRVGVVLDIDGKIAPLPRLEAALSLSAGVIASLCQGDALVDVLVTGEQVHSLSLGRGLGSVDQALDALAGVRPGPRLEASRVLARLGPHLERLSSVVIVALGWDDERAALARAIRQQGVGCSVLVVGPEGGGRGSAAPSREEALVVPEGSITRGEALSL